MPIFEYKATSVDGKIFEGQREETDQSAVISWLQASGYIPIYAKETATTLMPAWRKGLLFNKKSINANQLLEFTEQLATLVKAKLPVDHALRIFKELSEHENVRNMSTMLLEDVEAGIGFSNALEKQKSIFSPYYINMVRASEAGGNLELGLSRMYYYLDSAKTMRDKLISSLIYPAILVVVAVMSLLVIMTFVDRGNNSSLPANSSVIFGTTKVMITSNDITATTTRIAG